MYLEMLFLVLSSTLLENIMHTENAALSSQLQRQVCLYWKQQSILFIDLNYFISSILINAMEWKNIF